MKKIIGFLGLSFVFLIGALYLFYFYLPSFGEPEGLSLEIKTKASVERELGFIPVVSPLSTVFLPENSDMDELEAQREDEQQSLQALYDQDAEAARKKRTYRGYGGAAIPGNWQTMNPKVIEMNLSAQTLSRWENGNKLDENRISSGKRGMATPTGLFRIRNKADIAYSRKYRVYMPYWMAFTSAGHGIHELPIFKSGKREGENHLGTPVSHGCVRLGVGPAQTFYNWTDVGTPIIIHN